MLTLIYSSYFLSVKYDLYRFFKNVDDFDFKQIKDDLVENNSNTNEEDFLAGVEFLDEFSVYFSDIGRLNKIKFLANIASLNTNNSIVASLSLNKLNARKISEEFVNATINYIWSGLFPVSVYMLTTGGADLRIGYPLLKDLIANFLVRDEKFLKYSVKTNIFKKNSFLSITEFISLIVKRNHILYTNNPVFF